MAITRRKTRARLTRLRRRTGHEGDPLETLGRPVHERCLTMERAVFVYTTWPSIVEAEQAGRSLVERRLAACVNILPGMISHYRWQGEVNRAEEAVMIVKTRAALAESVRTAVKDMHAYEVPSIVVLPVESVDAQYYRWILEETREA
jgi:periplasmic divalent cation tolerance protein